MEKTMKNLRYAGRCIFGAYLPGIVTCMTAARIEVFPAGNHFFPMVFGFREASLG